MMYWFLYTQKKSLLIKIHLSSSHRCGRVQYGSNSCVYWYHLIHDLFFKHFERFVFIVVHYYRLMHIVYKNIDRTTINLNQQSVYIIYIFCKWYKEKKKQKNRLTKNTRTGLLDRYNDFWNFCFRFKARYITHIRIYSVFIFSLFFILMEHAVFVWCENEFI